MAVRNTRLHQKGTASIIGFTKAVGRTGVALVPDTFCTSRLSDDTNGSTSEWRPAVSVTGPLHYYVQH